MSRASSSSASALPFSESDGVQALGYFDAKILGGG